MAVCGLQVVDYKQDVRPLCGKCRNEFHENYQPVSAAVYKWIFNEEFNLGFYKPKKDQCGECFKFELMTPTEKEGYGSI